MKIDEVLFDDIASSLGDRAFPVTIGRDGKTCTGTGLSKRELFAAMAMQALLSNNAARLDCMKASAPEEDAIAYYAVEQADALLAKLQREGTD